jgi:hypothetical protein
MRGSNPRTLTMPRQADRPSGQVPGLRPAGAPSFHSSMVEQPSLKRKTRGRYPLEAPWDPRSKGRGSRHLRSRIFHCFGIGTVDSDLGFCYGPAHDRDAPTPTLLRAHRCPLRSPMGDCQGERRMSFRLCGSSGTTGRLMETVVDRCSMCGIRDMVRAPHKGGMINEGTIFMICPNCDGPLPCPKGGIDCQEPFCQSRTVHTVYPEAKSHAYLGVGPGSAQAA